MKKAHKGDSRQWRKVRLEEIFAPLEDGRTMHQGWSPQCEKQPSPSEKVWGVLRTTSIQPGEFQPEHNKLLPSKLEPRPLLEVKPGDILITCAGPRIRCGISCLVENTRRRLMISGKMYRFRTRPDEVLPKYLVAFLQSEDAATAIDGMKTGGSESGLNLTHERFRQLLVPIGPLAEQRRIVGVLDEAFLGLATAKANAEKNLQNARALFESHLQSVFTQRGPGWVETTLEKVLAVQPQNGWSPPAANHSASGTPVLTLSSVTGFVFRPDKLKYTSATTNAKARYWIQNGDFLITRSNTPELVGHVAIASGIEKPTIYPDLIMRMNPMADRALTEFLYYQLRTPALRAEIMGRAQGANPTMRKISNGGVKTLPIAVPSIATQKAIVGKLDALSEETQRLARVYERKLEALEGLKKSLLREAFAGEL